MDATLTKVLFIIGGILLILAGLIIWDVIDDKRKSKKEKK
jgi:hypothetical protein